MQNRDKAKQQIDNVVALIVNEKAIKQIVAEETERIYKSEYYIEGDERYKLICHEYLNGLAGYLAENLIWGIERYTNGKDEDSFDLLECIDYAKERTFNIFWGICCNKIPVK
jgi:hypothetical protein